MGWFCSLTYICLPGLIHKTQRKDAERTLPNVLLGIGRCKPSWVCVETMTQKKSMRGSLEVTEKMESSLIKKVKRNWNIQLSKENAEHALLL